MDNGLSGKVALVTGAARGLGRSYALRLAQSGASVIVSDVDLRAFEDYERERTALSAATVVEEVRNLGANAIGVEADVTDEQDVKQLIDDAVEAFGRIDILVANAGGVFGDFKETSPSSVSMEHFERTLDVNLKGTVLCCQATAEIMKTQRQGKIVTVSSVAALKPHLPAANIYATAKSGIITYTRYLARELAPYNINVNAIAPGIIETGMTEELGLTRDDVLQMIPMGRVGKPEDCAKVVHFLCTDLSDYMTGQVLVISGGMFMGSS